MSNDVLPDCLYMCVEDWFVNLLAQTLEVRLDAAGTGLLTWCPEWWRSILSIRSCGQDRPSFALEGSLTAVSRLDNVGAIPMCDFGMTPYVMNP